jgi:hypothetical protein
MTFPHKRRRRWKRKQHRPPVLVAALPASLHDSQVLTFRQWCGLNNFSARTGRRILSAPGGPAVTQLSARRISITVANNRTWQGSRERVS